MPNRIGFFRALLAILFTSNCLPLIAERPIPVKVIVVAMFEVGEDTGDLPGELQYWVERDHLDRVFPLPAGYHSIRMNGEGEMAVLTGQGTAHAAATIMALGLDPRFDLTHAYWIIAGIAGGSPDRVSLGSAAWARWVVDGDLGYEIDPREMPGEWSTGYIPLRKTHPFEKPAVPSTARYSNSTSIWRSGLTTSPGPFLSPTLTNSNRFAPVSMEQLPNLPPTVIMGDEVSGSTYWHGKLSDAWATEWMSYFTGGEGKFATTAMEDTGSLQSLEYLSRAGRVDKNRVMVLRTVSNFDRQPRDMDAAASLASQRIGTYSAYIPSLEAAYAVGHTVVSELLTHWPKYNNATVGKDQFVPAP